MGLPADMLRPPAPGHGWYLPEIYWQEPEFPRERAISVTAHHVVRWADRYFARRSVVPPGFTSGSLPFQVREGLLPAGAAARRDLLDDLLRWLRAADEGEVSFGDMELNRGERSVLNGHDGFPGVLQLTPRQYASLRRAWRASSLPEDLYYPAANQRTVVEPVVVPGLGPARMLPRSYSPRGWERRDAAAIEAIHVPTEEERRAAFAEACDAFHRAVMQRLQDFHQEGTWRHSEEYEEVFDLSTYARSAFFRFGPPAAYPSAHSLSRLQLPTAGFREYPTARESLEAVLPALRRLYPGGRVHRLESFTTLEGGAVGRWELAVWEPDSARLWKHYVRRGVLLASGDPLAGERWSPEPCPPLAVLTEGRLAAFLDHPRALEIAARAGADAFCGRTGGRLVFLHLRCYASEPARLLWRAEYWGAARDETMPWRAPADRFRVALDALTGEVVAVGPVSD